MDWWHIGTVVVVSITLTCEIWYGYFQHAKRIWDEHYGPTESTARVRWYSEFPRLDRMAVRAGEESYIEGPGGETVEVYTAEMSVKAGMITHSHFVRGVGRILLAVFVIAGFAAGHFELPWLIDAAEEAIAPS